MFNNSKPSLVARDIAKTVLEGEVSSHALDPWGISKLSVRWKGQRVEIRWFSDKSLCSIKINADVYPYAGGDSKHILGAALARAPKLLSEKMRELESKLEEGAGVRQEVQVKDGKVTSVGGV